MNAFKAVTAANAFENVRGNRKFIKTAVPYLLLLPAFAFILSFKFYPILNTVALSFQKYSLMNTQDSGFIGFGNYIKLFAEDPLFYKTFINSIWWCIGNVAIQVVLGMLLALLLTQKFKGRGLYRAFVFAPWAVSGILVALMWSFMYSESVGVFNDILMKLGIIKMRISWFSVGSRAMLAMIIAATWRGIPFFAISLLASLQTISDDIYESSKIDGVNAVEKFFFITLPIIKDTLVLTTLLRTIWTLNTVDIIYATTRGGPNFSTSTIPVYVMTTFLDSLDFGYTSVISVVMCLFLIVVSIVFLKITKYGKDALY